MHGFGDAGRRVLGDLRAGSVGLVAGVAFLMVATAGWMLADMRNCAWVGAARESRNLALIVERAVARDLEVLDLALQGAAKASIDEEVGAASSRLRQMAVYDNGINARGTGMVMTVDAEGTVTSSSRGPMKDANVADRPYFTVHRDTPQAGLYVGEPVMSRFTGEMVMPLSRRISGEDGSFRGVAVGTIKLSYFRDLFRSLALQSKGAVNLYHLGGALVAREPALPLPAGFNIRGSVHLARYTSGRSGDFVAEAVTDKVERRYEFVRIGDLPLVVSVAVSTDDILAMWRTKAAWIGMVLLALCLGMVLCLGRLRRELRRRAWAERNALEANERLALLAATDPLTGLANRRRFDEALDEACRPEARRDRPLCLAMLDADHFKRLNDRHGHLVGDAVLRAVAGRLAVRTRRPGELACRFGGEEFVALLPGLDLDAAEAWAERVRSEVAVGVMERDGIEITLSVGIALAPAGGRVDPAGLVSAADAALYEAKRAGRDRVVVSNPAGGMPAAA